MHKKIWLFVTYVALSTEIDDPNTWFVDSRASMHMSYNKHWFENFHETNIGTNIYRGDDRAHEIKGHGDVPVKLPNGCVNLIQNMM